MEDSLNFNLSDLENKSLHDLQEVARELGVTNGSGSGRKDELIARILQVQTERNGLIHAKGILEIREEEFDRTIAVNLKSCFNFIHATAPIMLKQETGGRIASMSSLNALSGGVTSAVSKHAYAAAKADILGLTRSLAKELGPRIMINAICPGVIETELGNSLTRSRGEEMKKGIMLNRLGSPADIAQLVAFLATSEPCFITGQHFVIDGFQWSVDSTQPGTVIFDHPVNLREWDPLHPQTVE